MPDDPSPAKNPQASASAERLDSWKEIAAYLRRDVTTVQRWEKREGMPVHRHVHDRTGSVYAFRAELDAWARSRSVTAVPAAETVDAGPPVPAARARPRLALVAAATAVLAVVVTVLLLRGRAAADGNPLEGARFQRLTDFDGAEQAAAISRDGRFVAFQSDRDGRMDVWVTQAGTGRFVNLTRGSARELVNPSVRTIGFSPDGSLVTFWSRGGSGRMEIGTWAVPLLGGPARPFLEGAAELDWSRDGGRLVYHTTEQGDPTFLRDASGTESRPLFSAPAGRHAHFPTFSPDDAYLYFVEGSIPDRTDLWRVPLAGGARERVTRHDSRISHPVFLDPRTLLYLAPDPDGSGPWIHALDTRDLSSRRVDTGVDTYTSLAASADGRRIAATLASPKRSLWRVPLDGTRADLAGARRIALTTRDGTAPRLGPDFLLYVSAGGAGDGLWKLKDGVPTELWSAPGGRVLGAPAVRRDGRRIAFTARQDGRTVLRFVNADGTDARAAATGLELLGTPVWAPDGASLLVSALSGGVGRLYRVPLDGRPPEPVVVEASSDAAWSPNGEILVYSGPDIGATIPVRAVRSDGRSTGLRPPTLTRGSRHLAFLPSGSLVVLRGDLGHRDLWAVDLETGGERRLTEVAPDFDLRDFDVSPDGTELVLERAQENADVVLIERRER